MVQSAEFVDLVLIFSANLELIFANGCLILFRELSVFRQSHIIFEGLELTIRRCIMVGKAKHEGIGKGQALYLDLCQRGK